MANEKLTQQTELTLPDSADWLYVVDKSDTTDGAAGSSRKISIGNLMTIAPVQSVNGAGGDITGIATEAYVNTQVGNEESARITADTALETRIETNETDIAGLQTDLDALTTSDIPEGSNLYHTDARVDSRIAAADLLDLADTPATYGTAGQVLATNSSEDGTEWVTVSSGGGGGSDSFNTIVVSGQASVVADGGNDTLTLIAGANISITTDAVNDRVTFDVVNLDTDDVAEATNLYYTDARVETKVNTMGLASTSYVDTAVATEASARSLADSNLQSSISTNSSDILSLNTQVSANTGAITSLNSQVSSNDTDIANLDSRVTTNESDIAALQAQTIPSNLTDLNDTPASLGTAGQILAVASGGTTTEWVDQSGGGTLTDTDDLPEGATNFYYTDTRVQTYLTSQKIRANYPTNTFTGNTQITATYEQTMMIGNSATSITFQVASGLARDCEILVMQYGAGDITITGATGVTIRTTSDFNAITAGQYAIIGLKQIGTTDEYIVTGERKPV